jgi:hypothetical protein
MNNKQKASLAGLVAIGVILATTASSCDSATEPFRDAPRDPNTNSGAARIIEFPDGFSNWSAKCDGPNMIYSGYHGNDNRISGFGIANDPRCTGAKP